MAKLFPSRFQNNSFVLNNYARSATLVTSKNDFIITAKKRAVEIKHPDIEIKLTMPSLVTGICIINNNDFIITYMSGATLYRINNSSLSVVANFLQGSLVKNAYYTSTNRLILVVGNDILIYDNNYQFIKTINTDKSTNFVSTSGNNLNIFTDGELSRLNIENESISNYPTDISSIIKVVEYTDTISLVYTSAVPAIMLVTVTSGLHTVFKEGINTNLVTDTGSINPDPDPDPGPDPDPDPGPDGYILFTAIGEYDVCTRKFVSAERYTSTNFNDVNKKYAVWAGSFIPSGSYDVKIDKSNNQIYATYLVSEFGEYRLAEFVPNDNFQGYYFNNPVYIEPLYNRVLIGDNLKFILQYQTDNIGLVTGNVIIGFDETYTFQKPEIDDYFSYSLSQSERFLLLAFSSFSNQSIHLFELVYSSGEITNVIEIINDEYSTEQKSVRFAKESDLAVISYSDEDQVNFIKTYSVSSSGLIEESTINLTGYSGFYRIGDFYNNDQQVIMFNQYHDGITPLLFVNLNTGAIEEVSLPQYENSIYSVDVYGNIIVIDNSVVALKNGTTFNVVKEGQYDKIYIHNTSNISIVPRDPENEWIEYCISGGSQT